MTPLQLTILRHIHHYHFLTNRQLFTLGLGNQQVIRRATRQLATAPKKSPYLIRKSFPPHARLGRMGHVFALGDRGRRYLEEVLQEHFEKTLLLPFTTPDYFHRLAMIDIQIGLDTTKGVSVPWCVHYFAMNRTDHGLRPRLRLDFSDGGFTIPDGAFALAKKNQNTVFLVEYVRGYRQSRTLAQIGRHTKLIAENIVIQKWHLPNSPKVLFIFEHTSHAQSILKKLATTGWFAPFAEWFLFAPMDAFILDPLKCWRMVHRPRLISLYS